MQIKHRFTGEVLFEADVGSLKLCLQAAVAKGADLRSADLRSADLRSANLSDANLGGAYLGGANLSDAGQDRCGYQFIGAKFKDGLWVKAGCRWLSITDARSHWGDSYSGGGDLIEITAKLDLIEAVAKSRGWLSVSQKPPYEGRDYC